MKIVIEFHAIHVIYTITGSPLKIVGAISETVSEYPYNNLL